MTLSAWHGKTRSEHEHLVATALHEGLHLVSISIYGGAHSPRFAGVAIDGAHPKQRCPAPQPIALVPLEVAAQATEGYHPVLLSVTGEFALATMVVVYEHGGSAPDIEFALRYDPHAGSGSVQAVNARAATDSKYPVCLGVYGSPSDPLLAGIWAANEAQNAWNADGLADSSSEYQQRFDAHGAVWCRPVWVVPNGDRYTSIFRDDQVGPWSARHDMTSHQYQKEFEKQTAGGFVPISVHGTGSGSAARYTAIFAKSPTALPKAVHHVGSAAVPDIDHAVHALMKLGPIRHASVAVVYQGRLVHARAYTYAEDGWPHTAVTTCFRQASVSKTVAALALWRHILHTAPTGAHAAAAWPAHCTAVLGTKLQDLLHITDVYGHRVTGNFDAITLKDLIEHRSGVADVVQDDLDILAANLGLGFPVTDQQTERYAATKPCATPPTAKGVYNGMGYYLLSRAVAALAGKADTFEALDHYVLGPLHMSRTRSAPQTAPLPHDEARYTSRQIAIAANITGTGPATVQDGYGNNALHRWVGAGGLSAPPIDIARMAALFTIAGNTSFLPRYAIDDLATRAIANHKFADGARAGYGFDSLATTGHGYWGNKGGDLSTTSTGLFLNGDWAVTFAFTSRATSDKNWYDNDFAPVFEAAASAGLGDGSTDLFPHYGMPALTH